MDAWLRADTGPVFRRVRLVGVSGEQLSQQTKLRR